MATRMQDLTVKIFADAAHKAQILEMAQHNWIGGFTTNPSLMKSAQVFNYSAYANELLEAVPDPAHFLRSVLRHVSEMVAQARAISGWGTNVYVKLPVMTTRGEELFAAIRELSRDGIKINVTAVFTPEQVSRAIDALADGAPAWVSIFAGRLADAGIDYRPTMRAATQARDTKNVKIIWASTREVFNILEADEMRCPIITAPVAILKKLPSIGSKTAIELSLEAVKAFRSDALSAGLTLTSGARLVAE